MQMVSVPVEDIIAYIKGVSRYVPGRVLDAVELVPQEPPPPRRRGYDFNFQLEHTGAAMAVTRSQQSWGVDVNRDVPMNDSREKSTLFLDLYVEGKEASPGPDDIRVREPDAQEIPDLISRLPCGLASDVADNTHTIEDGGIKNYRHGPGIEGLAAKRPGIRAVCEVKNAGEDAGPGLVALQDLIRF